MNIPTFSDVLLAQRQLRPYLKPTPLHTYPAMNELIGTEVYIKHENYQPVGAFKVRGGINLISQLRPDERARGVIAASTGNHGQSIAYAARLFNVKARIVVPQGANPGKVAAMQGMGAEVIFHGNIYDDAGQLDQAVAHYRESIRYYEQAGNLYGAATTRENVAITYAQAGRLDDALLFARAALRNFEQFGPAAAAEAEQARQRVAWIEGLARGGG